MKQVVTAQKPRIPAGMRKEKFCDGGYKPSIIGRDVDSKTPVWAERRCTRGPLGKDVWYRLYTYTRKEQE